MSAAPELSPIDLAHYRSFGFVVLRGAFDPRPLADEFDRALADGCRAAFSGAVAQVSGRYLPMMCERTPVSLALLDRFAVTAAELLGAPVLPVRAKGVLYFASSTWHSDSTHDFASVGFAAYLEPLRANTGALRVLPGSHRREFADAVRRFAAHGPAVDTFPGVPLETQPGDVIAFDEHLYHASLGGRDRRQWRVDYIVDPAHADDEAAVRAFYAGLYSPDWDGGYDVDRYPTYGAHWLASGRPYLHRLTALGAHAAAAAEEAAARARRG